MADDRLNLNINPAVKHAFSVACSLNGTKMSRVLSDFMREYARTAYKQFKMDDPFGTKPHKQPVQDAGKAAAKGRR